MRRRKETKAALAGVLDVTPRPARADKLSALLTERGSTHGDKPLNFGVLADLWNVYLAGVNARGRDKLDALDASNMMILAKIARAIAGDRSFDDHYADAEGYARISRDLAAALRGGKPRDTNK